jgi:hypothetical protein
MGRDEAGYKKGHGGRFHVVVAATLTTLAKAVVVVSSERRKKGELEER